jgi:L-asparaginase II
MQVVQRRGGFVEAVHPFSVAVVQSGQVVQRVGATVRPPMRSSAKPFQLACSLEVLGDPALTPEELAVGAASHTAEAEHLRLVRGLMHRFRVDPSELKCGGHPPLYRGADEARIREGTPLGAIHNNCSGKHTFMVAASKHRGFAGDYLDTEHPLQRRIAAYMAELAGEHPQAAIDGCGAPSWVLSLEGMARAWECLTGDADARLAVIGAAMLQNPFLTSGTGRLDLHVMEGRQEDLIVKIGAQALFCMALPKRGMGFAIKVNSGCEAALGEAVAWTLERFAPGAWRRPDGWGWGELTNVVGKRVGDLRVESE